LVVVGSKVTLTDSFQLLAIYEKLISRFVDMTWRFWKRKSLLKRDA